MLQKQKESSDKFIVGRVKGSVLQKVAFITVWFFFFQFSFNSYMLTISSSLFILLFILMIYFGFSSSCKRLSEMPADPGLFFLIQF